MTESPVATEPTQALRALIDLLRARANAARQAMRSNSTYWGPDATDEAFTKGIDGAVGDEYLASSFTPGVANTLADLLDALVGAHGGDLCSHQEKIFNTARELAERYPGLDLAGNWPLSLQPRPDEPLEFGAMVTGWTGTPAGLTEWVSLGSGYWVSKAGKKCLWEDIVVTGISR